MLRPRLASSVAVASALAVAFAAPPLPTAPDDVPTSSSSSSSSSSRFRPIFYHEITAFPVDLVRVLATDAGDEGEDFRTVQSRFEPFGWVAMEGARHGEGVRLIASGTTRVVAELVLDGAVTDYVLGNGTGTGTGTGNEEQAVYLEPDVVRHVGVIPPPTCRRFIEVGEETGFPLDRDSIDDGEVRNQASQSIEVYTREDGIRNGEVWALLEGYLPGLADLVRAERDAEAHGRYQPGGDPDRPPELGWIFFRKYSPETERHSLKLHVDTNLHTLNIALNDDYEGGGLFYVRPRADLQHLADSRPFVSDKYKSYDGIDRLRSGRNGTDVVFPRLDTGDALIHNYTVWHAVAPIGSGTRYSLVLFYDMDNPAVRDDLEGARDDGHGTEPGLFSHEITATGGGEGRATVSVYAGRDGSGMVDVRFYHELEGGADADLDMVWVELDEETGEEIEEVVVEEGLPPYEYAVHGTYSGHVFRALRAGTDVVISEIEVRHDPGYDMEPPDMEPPHMEPPVMEPPHRGADLGGEL